MKARKTALKPAKINLRNVLAVLQVKFIKTKSILGIPLPEYKYEQIIWRRTRVMIKSRKCWEKGACVWCGCDILEKTMEDRACERGDDWGPCYPNMMDKETWNNYKTKHNIKLFN